MRGPRSSTARLRRVGRRSHIRGQSRETTHTSLDSFLGSLPPGDAFGDDHRTKQPGVTRVVFQNINGVPNSANSGKQHQINQWLKNENVGIALFAEVNRHWPSVPEGNRWPDRMRHVSKSGHYSAIANNINQKRHLSSSFQYGGCIASIFNDVSKCAKESGHDPSGLGRWAYVRVRGKQFAPVGVCAVDASRRFSKDLVVISAYRPNPPSAGESTVWAQHQRYFNKIGRQKIDPREAFTQDLAKAVTQWRNQGCEIILGIDANEDLSKSSNDSFRSKMKDVGLSEAILSRHHVSVPKESQSKLVATTALMSSSPRTIERYG